MRELSGNRLSRAGYQPEERPRSSDPNLDQRILWTPGGSVFRTVAGRAVKKRATGAKPVARGAQAGCPRQRTRSGRYGTAIRPGMARQSRKARPSLAQVMVRPRKASRHWRPASLRVPPLILRLVTGARMSRSELLVCSGISGRSAGATAGTAAGAEGDRALPALSRFSWVHT